MCSISIPAWCEELPRCSAPQGWAAQSAFFYRAVHTHGLQPALSLVLSLPELRFTCSRAASSSLLGVLDRRLCSPTTIKILEVILCLAMGREVMRAWHGLRGAWQGYSSPSARTTVISSITSHIPHLAFWQLQKLC